MAAGTFAAAVVDIVFDVAAGNTEVAAADSTAAMAVEAATEDLCRRTFRHACHALRSPDLCRCSVHALRSPQYMGIGFLSYAYCC